MSDELDTFYSVSFDYALNAIFLLDDRGTIILANESAANLLQITLPKLIGQEIWSLIPKAYLAGAKRDWVRFLKSNKCLEGIYTILDGNKQPVQTEYRAIANIRPHQHLGILRDITECVDIAAELALSESRYRYLTSIYPVGIFHADADGNDVYINEKAAEIMDLSFEEAMGKGWAKNLHPEEKWVEDIWYDSIGTEGSINVEYRFVHKDGKIVWVKGQSVPEYNDKGELTGFVGTLTDITKLHEAEEEIRQNQIELAHYSRVNLMGEMASGIAHELNQPLTAIANYARGTIRRLQNRNNDPEIIESLTQIAEQAERAGAIIHHLKDFLYKGAPKKSACNINNCITNTLTIVKNFLNNNNVTMSINLNPNIDNIYADGISLEQVIINLINNAIEAMAEQIEAKCIRIKSSQIENFILVEISDTGPGILDELKNTIFNPFITSKVDGMGIGLSLSTTIIEAHGGKLVHDNLEPRGSKFTISLPKH